jgi:PAS domain S-box-containing protein
VVELSEYVFSVLREGEPKLYRGRRDGFEPILLVLPLGEHPEVESVRRLEREYALRAELDPCWAAQPLALERYRNRIVLVLKDPGGEPLDQRLGRAMDMPAFLRLSIGLAGALRQMHGRGFVHKDIKPANVLVDALGEVRLTGFGMASRLPRERQLPAPPEVIAGTLAYMAPEQTGRMNRSIDARSDLYSLGVTLYEMITGALPFNATDPMEWVHCHIARRPPPPSDRVHGIPGPVEAIILKLLAKIAEERYLTAAGLETDLRRCWAAWEDQGRIEPFVLGASDVSDQLLIPEKLYGRETEISELIAAFGRVVSDGAPELVLVSGYSGIGKSTVINELHKALVPSRGLFAVGKFDQYKRDIPYSTLAQAFQSLVRQILGKGDEEVGRWRDALREAVGVNGQLIANLIPEVELVIGEQPPAPDLPPQDARNRFETTFLRFVGAFARPEHPLALFLDDLQWLDSATLALIELLLSKQDVRHLMLVGAYRDNEVSPSHPLMRALASIRRSGARVHEIVLLPLELDDVSRLVAEALHTERGRANPLAGLVYEKTGGNPLFAIQFITTLVEEGLIFFDPTPPAWQWNIEGIRAKGYTDNLADLMAGKLSGLPADTLEALKQLACLGYRAQSATLSMVLRVSETQLHATLWPVIWAGIVFHSEGAYAFLHDRVQEAAYALIPDNERAAVHLRIGRTLVSEKPTVEFDENIFEIVNQLNRGAELIHSQAERQRLAELNLVAGERAKRSTAYASAMMFFAAGGALLSNEDWELNYALAFALAIQQAECEYSTGDLASAEKRLATLSVRAGNIVDRAAVACLSTELYTNLDKADRAVEIGLQYLAQVGVEWTRHPTDDEVSQEYARIWRQLGSRAIGELIDLPPMTDPVRRATLDVLTSVHAPANFTDENLLSLIIGRMANLSLEFGNGDGSCLAYTYLGMILESRFGDYRAGFQFGKLGVDLVERGGLDRFKARVYLNFGNAINPWSRHVRTGFDVLNRAFDTAQESGDLTFVAYSCANLISAHLAAGTPLSDVQREAEIGLAFVRKVQFGTGVDLILAQLGVIRALRGLTPELSSFNTAEFDERRFEQHLDGDPGLAMPSCWYWIRKLQGCFYARDYRSAVAAASKAETMLWTSPAFLVLADYHFYGALARSALYESASDDERPHLFAALETHHERLKLWADNCPENFENRAALVGAEIASIQERDLDAMRLYELAIRSARQGDFVQQEALAEDLAARFYAARGFDRIALTCMRDARRCYARWGAEAKVHQLEALHPYLREIEPAYGPTVTIAAPIERLDLATVIKVSQSVSSEIVLERLIDTLMRTALEHAGAERGLLLLLRGNEMRQQAEAITSGDAIVLRGQRELPTAIPESIIHYVVRTREIVILDDASAATPFSADPYILQCNARSILCLPLMNQAKLTGVLYLENNLTSRVFTPNRIAVLKLLASQAAISLENTYLYSDLAEREAKIRRLVDANIIGIFIWNLQGQIEEANQAFLKMVGYDQADLVSGSVRWRELTPLEWRERDAQALVEVSMTGAALPYEKEFIRKDGSRAPVLIGAATFDERRDFGVAFVVDLTERKRAEADMRESERRFREVQVELAHANRVATMGELTASIAHEVNHPVAAALMNAQTALRLLDGQPPDLERARRALVRIVNDAKRAANVIEGIRNLFKKAPARDDNLEINEAIAEMIGLTRSEMSINGILVKTQMAKGLPLIRCDRVQLQQVILNLLMNAKEAMRQTNEGPRELMISTESGPGGVLVAVRDSGPELDQASLERVFDAFYTTKPGGLGMGLSICRSIVEAHGGRLWAAPNEPHGAAFFFLLPAGEMTLGH